MTARTCETPDMVQFQERIKTTRKARNMSLEDVAAASGFTKSHVWELERGRARNPTVRAVWSLANALGVSPAWLLGLETGAVVIAPLALEIAALIERRIARDAVQLHTPTTQDTRAALTELIASTADQYGDTER